MELDIEKPTIPDRKIQFQIPVFPSPIFMISKLIVFTGKNSAFQFRHPPFEFPSRFMISSTRAAMICSVLVQCTSPFVKIYLNWFPIVGEKWTTKFLWFNHIALYLSKFQALAFPQDAHVEATFTTNLETSGQIILLVAHMPLCYIFSHAQLPFLHFVGFIGARWVHFIHGIIVPREDC